VTVVVVCFTGFATLRTTCVTGRADVAVFVAGLGLVVVVVFAALVFGAVVFAGAVFCGAALVFGDPVSDFVVCLTVWSTAFVVWESTDPRPWSDFDSACACPGRRNAPTPIATAIKVIRRRVRASTTVRRAGDSPAAVEHLPPSRKVSMLLL
jgi:hypothetical protein